MSYKKFWSWFFWNNRRSNYALNKEGIYIYKYNTFTDVLHRLDIKLTAEEIHELKLKK